MSEAAVILTDAEALFDASRVEGVLKFFGIAGRVSTVRHFLEDDLATGRNSQKLRVFCSSRTLWNVLKELEDYPGGTSFWRERVHSIFVCADSDSNILRQLVRRVISHDHVPLIQWDRGLDQWMISDKFPLFCGSMSGLRIPAARKPPHTQVFFGAINHHDTAFVKGAYETVPVFLLASSDIIDVNAPLGERNFDIRDHVLSAAPIVMFVKWAFADMCWKAQEASACLMIDDPLLRPTYGFLNYQELLSQMNLHNFTTNIAFIPWNWRRCDSSVVNMFRSHADRYSVSIHGCDHTGGEFGTQDVDKLTWKSRLAIDRMMRLERKTGINHDRIMVFPQGVFSGASMAALKHTQYVAAVNTEVFNHDLPRLPIAIADVWDVAVMSYGCFPIFTRRYPLQGRENLAFDILLGKPCIVASHHDVCRNHQVHLVDFIDQLNALNCPLSWRSLGEVVRRSCRQREVLPNVVEVEMYGKELLLENNAGQQKRYSIARRETDGSSIKEVCAGSRKISWNVSNGRLHFECELNAGESAMISIVFHEYPSTVKYRENLKYKLKVMLRRYLSEVRDNYVVTRWNRLP